MTRSRTASGNVEELFSRYRDLQQYMEWSDGDACRVGRTRDLMKPCFAEIIDDFYDEISVHPEARAAITGGTEQIGRLKRSLCEWLDELLSGQYDEHYVDRRWRVGLRHCEIGLDQIYTNAALARLRNRLNLTLQRRWKGPVEELLATMHSLNKLLDLDMAIIGHAYESAYIEQQQRSERLIAVGQMAGGVAHELRNPLNVVKTSIYYLLNARSPTADKTAEHLRRIERQVGLADKVITALVDFARLPFPQVRPIRIESSVTEAIELLAWPPGIAVSVAIEGDVCEVTADPDQLRIVFSNLFRNAIDAMPAGGRLNVRASLSDEFADIAVTDSGVGMPSDVLGRIMQPLYSTKSRGLGLGLAITRAIVEKHGGQLLVTSQEGQGSTFTVRLPKAGSPA